LSCSSIIRSRRTGFIGRTAWYFGRSPEQAPEKRSFFEENTAIQAIELTGYLAAIAIFCNEVKGKSALALSRDLGVSYKAAFMLLTRMRRAEQGHHHHIAGGSLR